MNALNFSNDIEGVLENIRLNSALLTEHHRKEFLRHNNSIKYYRIPVLLLSSIASVWSVSGTNFLDQKVVSFASCMMGLIAGTITSIELFQKIDEKMKLSEELSHKFYILSADIFKTLSLRDENRGCLGKDYLMETFSDYLKLIEKSNILSKRITDQLIPLPEPLSSNSSSSSINSPREPLTLRRVPTTLHFNTANNSDSENSNYIDA